MKLTHFVLAASTFIAFSAFSSTAIDQSQISDAKVKSQVGKSYYIQKDHPYLSKHRSSAYFADHLASFQRVPDATSCSMTSGKCSAISFDKKTKFTVKALIIPDGESPTSPKNLRCPQLISECFLQVTLEDSTVAFIRYLNFESALGISSAIFTNHPGLLQIDPVEIDERSGSSTRKILARRFKKMGVKLGFTKEDVLISQWGRPASKLHSTGGYGTIDLWTYPSGSITFVNDVVTDITNSH